MNKTLTTTSAAALLTLLAACSSNTSSNNASATASQPLTAGTAFTQIAAKIGTAKLSGTVTAENDPDHLLGRPNQYTSKVTFTDSRVSAADANGAAKGDVEWGGAIEAFADPSAAEARAKYIQAVTKSMPALAEYDYVHGTVLVRVSRYLTPKQATEYKTAANGLG